MVTLVPLLVLVAVLGTAGVWLLHRLGGSINVILHENYDSVIAMWELKEALEGIDASFRMTLIAGQGDDAAQRERIDAKTAQGFERHWRRYQNALNKERDNITILPAEETLFEKLAKLTKHYENGAHAFLARTASDRDQLYRGTSGLQETFNEIRRIADEIFQLNQAEMLEASERAKGSARASTLWLSMGVAVAIILAVFFAWHTVRTFLRPSMLSRERRRELVPATSTPSCPIARGTNWVNWRRPSTQWPIICATFVIPKRPNCSAPSARARRPSTRFPTRSSSSMARLGGVG